MNYYSASNAGREIAGQFFEITALAAGTAWGIFSTDDPALIAKLDALVKNPRNAVEAITREQYEAQVEQKKSQPSLNDFAHLRQQPVPQVPLQLKPTALPAIIQEQPDAPQEDKPVEITKALDTVEEALKTTVVQLDPAVPAPDPSEKPAKKKKV